ncbi:protein-glutamate methylesterase/protein-glutamine glutaminase [Candidatus Methylobacter favarea]|nr:chemotaxis response regulator protein-glutamate methylesterase [Candidatus Methylobacter favarea]
MNKIRVLIIDDSLLIRKMLTDILNSSSTIEVLGSAADPLIARAMIKQLNPDVLTLDIEMPHMDGLTFLRNLMRLRPTPVVMISTLTEQGAEATLKALALGAVDFIPKPKVDSNHRLDEYAEEIIAKVKIAARANVKNAENSLVKSLDFGATKSAVFARPAVDGILKRAFLKKQANSHHRIIAIGASTGGTEAVKTVARGLPADTPAVFITQHLPAAFSESFVRHIDLTTQMSAGIPQHNQPVEAGHIYLAPGDRHMMVVKDGGKYVIQLSDDLPVNRHKPAVDVLFRSIAHSAGADAIGVLLTGMGTDGASGLQEMHAAGAKTVIQDEPSSVVWGMPGAAFKLGCADYIVPLAEVANKILTLLGQGSICKPV